MLHSIVSHLAPTPTDIANWQFAIELLVFLALAFYGAFCLLEKIPESIARRRADTAADARAAADPEQDRLRRRQLDNLTAITGRRTH